MQLLAMRVALLILAAMPASLATRQALRDGVGARPWLADSEGPLGPVALQRLGEAFPDGLGLLAVVAVALVVLGDAVLTPGALAWLEVRGSRRGGSRRTPRIVWEEGRPFFGAMLRLAGLALVADAAGALLLDTLFDAASAGGAVAGRTAWFQWIVLPLLHGGAVVLWLSLVGSWLLVASALCVATGRRAALLAGWRALRAVVGAPISWAALAVALAAAALAPGAVWVAWRQVAPGEMAWLWALVWVVTLGVQAAAWLGLLRFVRARWTRGVGATAPG